jgi:HSP20 family molecular chaperone IbpA
MCDQRSYHEARISYGQFAADINVPFSVDGANATATYENGFLRISLPREPSHTLTPRQSEPNQESEDDVQG